ncbi:MAG: NADH:ubiquinone oxidoreductase [Candidatus Thermoplasmatota archaeon]|jgi:Ni,Fe-hydrogenase III small subunit|nr:NADH:ubiquinone oxidoreductase [Candidatus Thermoplasmatota archaeon]
MKSWLTYGLMRKRLTTGFPSMEAEEVPLWTTTPVSTGTGEAHCPANAIKGTTVEMGRCISCGYCSPAFQPDGVPGTSIVRSTEKAFRKSFHIYLFDAGSCGSCNLEVKALGNPYYDMSRLGISFCATPKHADALIVVGVLADGMSDPLKRAVEALPSPKLIFALGACAISGGIIGKSISGIVDADIVVPGCPPNPFTILDALQRSRGVRL